MNEEKDKSKIAKQEEKILSFWQEEKIFEKTLEKGDKNFVFYDGPPFANGTPHYGHLLASYIKDTIPRYKTMQGFRVPRRWGWDCHGLPVENEIEKKLGLKGKKEILDYGIEKFNEEASCNVLEYTSVWEDTIKRIGRFVDLKASYRTMDLTFTESIWWAFKNLYDRKLIYEGFKSMHLCPRCETTLSNFEVNQGYKDVTDISVTAKFVLKKDFGWGKVSVLAWTTTPWTLPGNVALAVNPKEEYVFVKKEDEIFVLAKGRLGKVFENQEFEILKNLSGKDLIGVEYEPVFDTFYNDKNLKNKENAWKIYGADFVTMEDGTGIVHIAPAFGEDDLNLGLKNNLPIVSHVGKNGLITIGEFKGLQAKSKESPASTDIEVLRNLAGRNLVFSKQKIKHSYPHCWRCESPLLNYATSSWFLKATDLKNKLVSENKKINWVPKEIGEGRFGNWLEGVRDWAISRSRFWGAPIPVWKCESCGSIKVAGSVDDISKKGNNNYILMRHGEAESNVKQITSGIVTNLHNLTEKGIGQVKKTAQKLKTENIDLIFYSPFKRTRETAMIVKEEIGLSDDLIKEDKRIWEINFGSLENKPVSEYRKLVGPDWSCNREKDFKGVEGRVSVRKRMLEFISEIDKKYKDKNILIVSHDMPLWILYTSAQGLTDRQATDLHLERKEPFFENAEFKKTAYKILPRDNFGNPDLHRPFIDNCEISCNKCGKNLKRVPEVMDCWFESGAMPFASHHYPFEESSFAPAKRFWQKSKGFPADFIAEGLDQTRGWFYSLLVLSTALFGKSSYKNVIVNGMILAEDGEKMSKRLKNYPTPEYILNKYGSDALRFYLLSSPVVRAEPVNFSEKEVDEVVKKLINRLNNVLSFYNLYQDKKALECNIFEVKGCLNKWILARLAETSRLITKSMDNYELDRASKPIAEFIDDLSVWYLRRSRGIFKNLEGQDRKNEAILTLNFVLREFSKILAPFMPFLAENLFANFKAENKLSVNLEDWPEKDLQEFTDNSLIYDMKKLREIVSLSLEARASLGIKVRQPLGLLKIKKSEGILSNEEFKKILLDEVNVKDVKDDENLEEKVWLAQELTLELKQEGMVREIIRLVQDLRKKAKLAVSDKVSLEINVLSGDKSFIEKSAETIAKATGLSEITFGGGGGQELELYDGLKISIRLIK